MALLGIDVGSSGCKAIVFSDTAQVLSEYYAEYPSVENPYEISGELIWDKVRTAILHCTELVSERIDAIGVSSFGESFVPIDKDGRVLMVTMLYTDKRGKIQCDELVGKLGNEKIMNITGVKPQSMYSLPKIMYIKENHPDVYLKTYKFLLIGSFIIYKLTGECVIDYSLASRTMGFDVINKEWLMQNESNSSVEEATAESVAANATASEDTAPQFGEQKEDASHLMTYYSASCVWADNEVDIDMGMAVSESVLEHFGFQKFKYIVGTIIVAIRK